MIRASYPGGKAGSGVYQAIINEMPPHDLYIEPFVGGGAVLRHKRPAPATIAIDADAEVARRWIAESMRPDGGALTAIHGDGIEFLENRKRWTGRELVYCDPPYLMSARRSRGRLYRHELADADHERLLRVLRALPCMVMVSGYAAPLYAEALAGWRLVTFTAMTRGHTPALEHLWCNFPAPIALHDCRYLGGDFRERERIRRKAGRWRRRLAALPALERQAVLSIAFADAAAPSPSSTSSIAGNGEAAAPAKLAMLESDIAGDDDARSTIAGYDDPRAAPGTAMPDLVAAPARIARSGGVGRDRQI